MEGQSRPQPPSVHGSRSGVTLQPASSCCGTRCSVTQSPGLRVAGRLLLPVLVLGSRLRGGEELVPAPSSAGPHCWGAGAVEPQRRECWELRLRERARLPRSPRVASAVPCSAPPHAVCLPWTVPWSQWRQLPPGHHWEGLSHAFQPVLCTCPRLPGWSKPARACTFTPGEGRGGSGPGGQVLAPCRLLRGPCLRLWAGLSPSSELAAPGTSGCPVPCFLEGGS